LTLKCGVLKIKISCPQFEVVWGGLWFFSSLQCDSYEIRPGKHLGVCISVANNRLFVGSIPKNKTKENILEEFSKVTGKTKNVFRS
jgi:hypothetical protein